MHITLILAPSKETGDRGKIRKEIYTVFMEEGGIIIIIISGTQSQVLILIGHSQIASFHRKIKYHNLIDRPLLVVYV